jgi:hypothetical protein
MCSATRCRRSPAVAIIVGLSISSGKDILNIIHRSPEE